MVWHYWTAKYVLAFGIVLSTMVSYMLLMFLEKDAFRQDLTPVFLSALL